MQAVDGMPRPSNMQGDICCLSLQEGRVDMTLECSGRMTVGDSETARRVYHRRGVRFAVFSTEIRKRRGGCEPKTVVRVVRSGNVEVGRWGLRVSVVHDR